MIEVCSEMGMGLHKYNFEGQPTWNLAPKNRQKGRVQIRYINI